MAGNLKEDNIMDYTSHTYVDMLVREGVYQLTSSVVREVVISSQAP